VRRLALALAAAALPAVAALHFARGARAPAPTPAPAAAAAVASAAPAEPAAVDAPLPSPAGPLSPALRETEVDGELTSDVHSDLVVTPEVRRFFDYFLIASGDVPADALRARVVAEIRRRLPERAAAQAIALFDRYLEYRRRAAELDAGGGDDTEARLGALWALRREVIGTRDAAAMFGEEEDAARAALERQRIQDDPRLSDQEKARALAEAEARLPEPERELRADAISAVQLWHDEQALRAQGASPEEIRALRVERVGSEAADRLDALDRERAAFQSTLAQARALQGALAADGALSPEQRASALQLWIAQHFPQQEKTHAGVLLGLPAN